MSLLSAVSDPEFRADVGRGLLDVGNRGVAGLLGGPVDLAALALSPLGYDHPAPLLGSEWIGQQMEKAGMVTPQRRPVAEFLATLATPGVAVAGARGLGALAKAAPEVAATRNAPQSLLSQIGAISPEGRARLMTDLQAGQGSGTYRLGDVTQGQARGLDDLFGRTAPSRDVWMTDDAFEHIAKRRMGDRQYTPEDVTRFVESAMERRARPELDIAKSHQNPALRNSNVLDPVTGRRHEVHMPLRQGEEGYEVRSIFAPGLPPRNEKAPKW